MSGSNENLRVGIDATGAKAGADTYKRELAGIAQAVDNFDRKTDLVFKSLKTRMQSVDFRSISQAASQINNIHINPSLATGITQLGNAMRNFRAPSANTTRDLSIFGVALHGLQTPTIDVARLAALTSSIRNFRAPSQQQTQNLRDFVSAINTIHVNNQNIDQIVIALHRVANAAQAARQGVSGLNASVRSLRAPRFFGGGGGRGGGGGSGGGSGNGPYDGIFSGSQRAVGEMRGLENVANPTFQAASVLRAVIPAITTGELFKSLYDEGAKLTQFQHVLEIATTVPNNSLESQRQLKDMMNEASAVALKFGLDLDTTREGLSHFAVNMKMSNFTLADTKKAFEDISSVMRATGTDATRQEQVWRGMNTVLANQKVMSLQLTRQFDQALPGFKQAMETVVFLEKHKMDPNTILNPEQLKTAAHELVDELKKGEVSASAMIKTISLMEKLTREGLPTALNSASTAASRFGTQWKLTEDKMLGQVGTGGLWDKMGEQINRMTDLLGRDDIQKFFMDLSHGVADALKAMGDAMTWVADHLQEVLFLFKAFLAVGMLNAVQSIGGAFGRMGNNVGNAVRGLLGLIPVMVRVNEQSLLGGTLLDRWFARLGGLPVLLAAAGAALATYATYQERNQKSNILPGGTNKEAWTAAIEVGKQDVLDAASKSAKDLLENINDVAHAFGMATERSVSWGDITLAAIVGVSRVLKSIAEFPHNLEFVLKVTGMALVEGLHTVWKSILDFPHNVTFVAEVVGMAFVEGLKRLWQSILDMPHNVTFVATTLYNQITGSGTQDEKDAHDAAIRKARGIGSGYQPGGVVNPEGGPTGEVVPPAGPNSTLRRIQQQMQRDYVNNLPADQLEAPSVGTTIPSSTASNIGSALQEGSGKTPKGPKDKTESQLDTLEKSLGDGLGMIRKFLDQKKILDDALAKGDFKNSPLVTQDGMTQQQAYEKDLSLLKDKLLETMGAQTAYGKAIAEVDKAQGMANAGVKLGILTQDDAVKMMQRVNDEHNKTIHPVEANIAALQKENQLLMLGTKEREAQSEVQKILDANKKAGGPDIDQHQIDLLTQQVKLHQQLEQFAANQNVGIQAWANSFQDLYTELGKVEQKLTGSLADAMTKFMTEPRKSNKNLKPGEVHPAEPNPFSGLLQTAKADIVGAMTKNSMRELTNVLGLSQTNGDPHGSSILGGIESLTGIPLRKMMGGGAPGQIGAQASIGSIMAAHNNSLPVSVINFHDLNGKGGEGGTGVFSNAKTTGGSSGSSNGTWEPYWDGSKWVANGSSPTGAAASGGNSAGSLGGNIGALIGSSLGGRNSNLSGILGEAGKLAGPALNWLSDKTGLSALFSNIGERSAAAGAGILMPSVADATSAAASGSMAATNAAGFASDSAISGGAGAVADSGGLMSSIGSTASDVWGSLSNGFSALMSMFAEGGVATNAVEKSRLPMHEVASSHMRYYADGTPNTRDTIPSMLSNDEAVIPLSRGRSIPVEMKNGNGSNSSGTGSPIHVHFHGVTDMNGFKNSESQIHASVGTAVNRAMMRNG